MLVDYVPAGEEDRELDPGVLEARDEHVLSEAQVDAELSATTTKLQRAC